MFLLILSIIAILILLVLAYEDYKDRYVHIALVDFLIVIGLVSAIYSGVYYPYSIHDIRVISIVTILTCILIYTKGMSEADRGLIGITLLLPYLTAIALLFYSIFVFIAYIKNINTLPFYTVFGIAMIMAIIFYSGALFSPHTCGEPFEFLDWSDYFQNYFQVTENNKTCSKPFIMIVEQEILDYQPDKYNYTFNSSGLSSV